MNFRCDLYERMQKANWARRKYWECPDTRLHRVNLVRRRRGLEPYASLDDVPPRGHAARRQGRGERGRFA